MVYVKWSPDGERLGYYAAHEKSPVSWESIETRDLRGGSSTTVVSQPVPNSTAGFSWLPDGRMIYSLADDNDTSSCNLWEIRADPRTGKAREEPRRLTNWAGFCVSHLSVTADGKRLAFTRWSGRGSVYVADLRANETPIHHRGGLGERTGGSQAPVATTPGAGTLGALRPDRSR